MNTDEPTVRSVAGRVAERWAETYLGDIPTTQLASRWRILCAFTGTFLLMSVAYFSKDVSNLDFAKLFSSLDEVPLSDLPMMVISATMMVISPAILAVMVGLSFKKGGPLRFFMLGFFFYSLVMSAAILQFPDIDTTSRLPGATADALVESIVSDFSVPPQ